MESQKATVNIFGRITTMTRRIVQTFEDTVTVDCPNEMLQAYAAAARRFIRSRCRCRPAPTG